MSCHMLCLPHPCSRGHLSQQLPHPVLQGRWKCPKSSEDRTAAMNKGVFPGMLRKRHLRLAGLIEAKVEG